MKKKRRKKKIKKRMKRRKPVRHRKIVKYRRRIRKHRKKHRKLKLTKEDLKKSYNIFRSYDIRGIYGKDLDEEIMYRIGVAFASQIKDKVVVGNDMRLSSELLCNAFIDGVVDAGKKVHFVGLVPLGTGMLHAFKNKTDFAYITASHMAKEWNGVKFYHKNGVGFFEKENYKIRDIFLKGKISRKKIGKVITMNNKKIVSDYIKFFMKPRLKATIKKKVILDCGNGCASIAAKKMFEKAGFDVVAIYNYLDGSFPNRTPEPSEDSLAGLKGMIEVEKADFGFAYDGDGDRFVLVDNKQRTISPEQSSYLILDELLRRKSGAVVANIECTRLIDDITSKYSRRTIRIPVGHTFLVQTVLNKKACFGSEASGHFIVPSLTPIDDSLAVSLYLAVILSKSETSLSDQIDEIPNYPFRRLKFECSDDTKFKVIDYLQKELSKNHNNITNVDGIRIEFLHGWILIRASNTSPLIRLSIEGQDDYHLHKMQEKFSKILEEAILAVG